MAPVPPSKKSGNGEWMRYMGMGAQFFGSIVISLVIGWKLDALFRFSSPVLIWILPLVAVISNLVKIIIETNKKKP